MNLPEGIGPDVLAGRYGWSERLVRSTARRLGACLVMGKTMTLLPKHVEKIMEAIQCPSNFTVATGSGITAELLAHLSGARGYGVRSKHQTKRRPRGKLPKSKSATGKVITMARRQS